MHQFFDQKFQKHITIIGPGDYYTSDNNHMIIQTVLGSCIAVCLYDEEKPIGGMNHFMLPVKGNHKLMIENEAGRYGMYAMELLINELIKKGLKKQKLKAKVFGGGSLLAETVKSQNVAKKNVLFILDYLKKEKIPIAAKHLGGDSSRKILFFIESKKVLLKESNKKELFDEKAQEITYLKNLEKQIAQKQKIIFFNNNITD